MSCLDLQTMINIWEVFKINIYGFISKILKYNKIWIGHATVGDVYLGSEIVVSD